MPRAPGKPDNHHRNNLHGNYLLHSQIQVVESIHRALDMTGMVGSSFGVYDHKKDNKEEISVPDMDMSNNSQHQYTLS
jgi:hypothetical protein